MSIQALPSLLQIHQEEGHLPVLYVLTATELKREGHNHVEISSPQQKVLIICVWLDLENSIKGVVQRMNKFSPSNPYRHVVF